MRALYEEGEGSAAVAAPIDARLSPIQAVAGHRQQQTHEEGCRCRDQPHPLPGANFAHGAVASAVGALNGGHVTPTASAAAPLRVLDGPLDQFHCQGLLLAL